MFVFGGFFVSQHMNAVDEAYMLRRPSSLFWCDSVTALSCLEISSVTLTPMSSPESNMSGGLLTPPPAKPPLLPPKPSEGCSIPRPRVKLLSCLSPTAACLSLSASAALRCTEIQIHWNLKWRIRFHFSFFNRIFSVTPCTGWQHLHETTVHRHFRHGSLLSSDTAGAHAGQQWLPSTTADHNTSGHKWVFASLPSRSFIHGSLTSSCVYLWMQKDTWRIY